MNIKQREIESKTRFYNFQFFDNYFKAWEIKPFLGKKWQNTKNLTQQEFYSTTCIFACPFQSNGFRLWLIHNQA